VYIGDATGHVFRGRLRYKAFFEACRQVPGVVERALELTEGLSMPVARTPQMPTSTFQPNGWRGW
jgi:hypothetical protein